MQLKLHSLISSPFGYRILYPRHMESNPFTCSNIFLFLLQELVTFAKFVLNRFFALAAKNNKAFVELLFWKSVGTVREMTEGYSKPGEGCVPGCQLNKCLCVPLLNAFQGVHF